VRAQSQVIAITAEQLEGFVRAMVRERVEAVLTPAKVYAMARRRVNVVRLATAGRWLGWRDLESLRKALARDGVAKVKFSARKTGYLIEDEVIGGRLCRGLRSFRNSKVVRGSGKVEGKRKKEEVPQLRIAA
jgi:hypothetical protein